MSEGMLSEIRSTNPGRLVITCDESWVYFDNPPSSQWIEPGGSPQKKAKIVSHNQKLIITVFFSRVGIEHIDVLPEGKTMDAEYFCAHCLKSLKEKICSRRKRGGVSNIVLHFDNAWPHTACHTKEFLEREGFSVLGHPPYSPDLSPCDFFLFGYLKGALEGTYAQSREELMGKIENILFRHSRKLWWTGRHG